MGRRPAPCPVLGAFETERLLLRPFEAGDLSDLTRLYAMPEVMQYVAPTRNAAQTRARLQKYLADREKYGFGLFAAVLKSDGAFIGRCGLDPELDSGELQGELAWMFFPQFWGLGLATEFAAKMLEIGHQDLALRRIFTRARPQNAASIRVMQKIGMRPADCAGDDVEYESVRGR